MRGMMRLAIMGVPGAQGGPSTLLNSLESYWSLDEASGARADSVGENNLTDTGSVAGEAGINNNGASFTGDAKSLSIADNDSVRAAPATSFEFVLWFRQPAAAFGILLSKWGAPSLEYGLEIYSTGRVQFSVQLPDNSTIINASTAVGAAPADAWHIVFCGYDAALDQTFVRVDGGATRYSATTIGGAVRASNAPFSIGSRGTNYFTGLIDEVLYYKDRALTDDDRLALYNSGAGRFYPFPHNSIPDAIAVTRAAMIDEIWSGNGYPTAGVDTIDADVTDPLDTSATNLLRVDQLTINLDDNAEGFVMANQPYVWHPAAEDANGKLVIVFYGHFDYTDWELTDTQLGNIGFGDLIRALVEDGYTVAGVRLPEGGTAVHNAYPTPTDSLNYLKFFLEPVTRIINELTSDFDAVYMTGLSGGGWATDLMAAIDTRIKRSVPLAGSLPLNIAVSGRDWEQLLPGIAHFVDYDVLYYMACDGGRAQKKLLNTDDPVGFNRTQFETAPTFATRCPIFAQRAGGTWSLAWDDTHEQHIISEFGRATILNMFNG